MATFRNIPPGVGALFTDNSTKDHHVFRLKDSIQTPYFSSDPNWTFSPNSDYAGQGNIPGTYDTENVFNLDRAKALCLATPNCNTFTYFNRKVQLKNIPLGTGTLTSTTAGSVFRLNDSILQVGNTDIFNTVYTVSDPNWVVTPGQGHYGQGDIGSFVGSVDAAKAKCLATPGCTEFAYGWGTAYLKTMLFNSAAFSATSGYDTYALSSTIKQAMETGSIRTTPGVWISGTANRATEFVEVDLGSNMAIASVRLIGRNDYNFTTNAVDRMTGVRINIYKSTVYTLPTSAKKQSITFTDPDITSTSTAYIRFRPASASTGTGDGFISLTAIYMVSSPTGTVYPGMTKPILSTLTSSRSGSACSDGSCLLQSITAATAPASWPNCWVSATANRETEFAEIAAANSGLSGLTVYGEGDTLTVDRMTNLRVEILTNIVQIQSTGITCAPGYSRLNDNPKEYYYNIPANSIACIKNCQDGSKPVYLFGPMLGAPLAPDGPQWRCNVPVDSYPMPTPVTAAVIPAKAQCPTGTALSWSYSQPFNVALWVSLGTKLFQLTNPNEPGGGDIPSCVPKCAAGETQSSNGLSCQPPDIKRTLGTAPTYNTPILCNAPLVYNTSLNICAPPCPAGTSPVYNTSTNLATCTKPDITRDATTATLTYTCNADEILQNGVCVSKCPDGSAPDGELCVNQMNVVPVPSDAGIMCTSSAYQTSKKWMCDSSDDVTKLLTNPTSTTTYVSQTDQVCMTEDPTTKMYYCVSGAEAKVSIDGLLAMGKDYDNTCSKITKTYTDLSNNLTNLIKIQNGMRGGGAQLGSASQSLTSIYGQMNCAAATGTKANLCSQIKAAASTVGSNSSDITTTLAAITPQISRAMGSRDTLLGYKSKFQCK